MGTVSSVKSRWFLYLQRITGICAYLSLTQRRRGRKGFYVVNWLHGLHRKSSWFPWSAETRKRPAWQQFHLWNHVDYLSPAYHGDLRVFVCTQKAQNTQNCDLFHSRSMRMKTFCEFCGFCVRYYFLVSREGAKAAKIFINVITGIIQIFGAGGMFDWLVRTYGPCVLNHANVQPESSNELWTHSAVRRTCQVGKSARGTVSSGHQNFRTVILTLRRESVSSVKSRWIIYGVLIRGY